jgi:hypothetical protein
VKTRILTEGKQASGILCRRPPEYFTEGNEENEGEEEKNFVGFAVLWSFVPSVEFLGFCLLL